MGAEQIAAILAGAGRCTTVRWKIVGDRICVSK
jgi:hypothetical protein